MRHFPGLRKVRQTVFLRCGKLPLGRGNLDASMRRGLSLFLSFGGRVLGHPGIAAEFAMAGDANRSMAAPAIDGNRSSAESIYAGGAAGSWRRIRRTTATAGTGAAAIPHAVDRAVRSAFGVPHVPMRKARHQNGRESPYARGDTGAEIQLPGRRAGLPKAVRSLHAECGQKTLRDRAFREIVW
jgi:hypothetical protein